MHLAFVSNALQQKAMGISDSFDELVDQFNLKRTNPDAPSPAPQLRLWILALSNVVSRLERCHSALVEVVVSLPWVTMDAAFVKTYTSFIGMLVSAKPEWLFTVLDKLAQGMTYQSGIQALSISLPESSSAPLTRRIVYDRLHQLLRHLLTLVPTLPSTLQPLLVTHFPHKRLPQAAQITYIRNLLRVMEYCPELSDRILATIVDRAIQIDVEIQIELEELEEHISGQQEVEIFDLDPFDTVVGQEGDESGSDNDSNGDEGDNLSDISSEAGGDDNDSETAEAPTDFNHVSEMVNKLDAILKNVFDYFSRSHGTSSPNSSPPSETLSTPIDGSRSPSPTPEERLQLRRSQFCILLSIFDRVILRTFKSRYTQFLIFWFASLDTEFCDMFQGVLVSKALIQEDQPAVTRAAAASYIASLVSRATFIDHENTRNIMSHLCIYLKSRLDMFDSLAQLGGSQASVTHYSVFYAVCQAVFLIFCFRWRDLQKDPEEIEEMAASGTPPSKWMVALDVLQRSILSDLNPLKMCSPNVVEQFARVAHATDFLYCYSIIEANKRSEFATHSSDGSANGITRARNSIHSSIVGSSMHHELNTFFPFDPYRLPRSGSYIHGVYREWSSVAIDDDEEDDEEQEDEEAHKSDEDGEESELPQRNAIPVKNASQDRGADSDGLGASFGGMSISPMQPVISSIPMSLS